MGELGRATIHDVARAAGVSHQTVSNVLHDRGRVASATRARVSAAIAALHYRPHAGAASLRTQRSGRLAHPIAIGELGPTNTIMLEFIAALTTSAGQHGQHLVLAAGGVGGLLDVEHLYRSGAVDAVVLASVRPHDKRVAHLARLGIPFAAFGRTELNQPQSWVDVDSAAGVRLATEHLVGRGHRRLTFVGFAAQGRWDLEREAGYRAAMAGAGLRARLVTPVQGPAVAAAIDSLLGRRSPPTAIVTGSDMVAAQIYAGAVRRGLQIGTDVAVTGFDDSLAGRLLEPSLTTLSIPIATVTDRVIARALAELDGPTAEPGELVRPGLVRGASG